jgi:hypothetical protein
MHGLALISALAAIACTRQAPGPAECQRFAFEVVGVGDQRLLAIPRVKDAVDEWTVRCLTTPYDRELLRCVERGEQACMRGFAARHPERVARDLRRGQN